MKQKTLNGTAIPYEATINELEIMASSSAMKDFSLACEALSYKNDPKAYEIMKSHINDKDKYRRLYILKTIFRHPQAAELTVHLEKAISSEDPLFVENGLRIAAEYGIKVSEAVLISSVNKNLPKLHYFELRVLETLDKSEENFKNLTAIFKKAEKCGQRQILGDLLIQKYLSDRAKELFDLFRCDNYAKIRLFAVKIAREFGCDLSGFLSDMDGHVRKLAAKGLGALSFLLEYAERYRVDISDDLSSAVIYNPVSDEHVHIFYEKFDEFTPYEISFSFQHIHATDGESAMEWIDGIMNEKRYSIEFFSGDQRRFGGEITSEELEKLSYVLLEKKFGGGMPGLLSAVDNFKVRGWSGKNDFDGRFVEKDGVFHIEAISL